MKILFFQLGMCVYTVLIISFTGVPVSLVVDDPNAHFCVIGMFIFFTTTLTLCMVFIPKVFGRFKKREDNKIKMKSYVVKILITQNFNGCNLVSVEPLI